LIDQALARLTDESARARYDVELANWKESQIPKETDWYAKANTYLDSEDYDLALEAVKKAIEKDGENGRLYLLAAEICHQYYNYEGNFFRNSTDSSQLPQTCLDYIKKAIVNGEEENPNSYLIRALASLRLNNYSEIEKNITLIRKFLLNAYDKHNEELLVNESYYLEATLCHRHGDDQKALEAALHIGEQGDFDPNSKHGKCTVICTIFSSYLSQKDYSYSFYCPIKDAQILNDNVVNYYNTAYRFYVHISRYTQYASICESRLFNNGQSFTFEALEREKRWGNRSGDLVNIYEHEELTSEYNKLIRLSKLEELKNAYGAQVHDSFRSYTYFLKNCQKLKSYLLKEIRELQNKQASRPTGIKWVFLNANAKEMYENNEEVLIFLKKSAQKIGLNIGEIDVANNELKGETAGDGEFDD
jgi:hypothetical protein